MTKRTEADLCEAFRSALEAGWIVYPEFRGSEDWDMLLVLEQQRKPTAREVRSDSWGPAEVPLEPGTQVGIEAKLRANVTVLSQALPAVTWRDAEEQAGPDFRAVLVPRSSADFDVIAGQLGIVVLEAEPKRNGYLGTVASRLERRLRHCTPWPHATRHKLPEVISGGPAGMPSPTAMTRWKIGAIRLCIRLRDQGFVTRQDFRDLSISTTTWYHRWLEMGEKVGRIQRWVAKEGWTPFDEQEPDAALQLREKDAEATG